METQLSAWKLRFPNKSQPVIWEFLTIQKIPVVLPSYLIKSWGKSLKGYTRLDD